MIVFRNLQLSESLNDFLGSVTSSGHMSDTDVQGSSIDLCQIPSDCSAFLPKLLITFRVEECGRHDVDNASSSNEICTRRILLKKSKVGANDGSTRLGCAPQKQLHW
jgi:hypothetical protein